jgi:hypothetical protein
MSVMLLAFVSAACNQRQSMKQQQLILTDRQIDSDDAAGTAWGVLLTHSSGLKGKKFTEHIRHLPQHWRAVYTAMWLECEVNNGGHHQFFWNSDGALNTETLEDLRLISARPFVVLFKKALAEYGRHDYAGDKQGSGNTWEAFTEAYDEHRMDKLDTAFYKSPKKIGEYLADYIRKNRENYLQDAEPSAAPNGGQRRRRAVPSSRKGRHR